MKRTYSAAQNLSQNTPQPVPIHTYVVPYAGSAQEGYYALVAKKNERASYFQNKPVDTIIRNNPGQHVFPGGKTKPQKPTIRDNAITEFREETGLYIDLEEKTIRYPIGHASRQIPVARILQHNEVNHNTEIDREHFGVLYLKIPGEDLAKIPHAFANTKAQSGRVNVRALAEGTSRRGERYIADDELASLQVLTRKDARGIFVRENGKMPESVMSSAQHLREIPPGSPREKAFATGWFVEAAERIPYLGNQSSLLGSSSGSSSGISSMGNRGGSDSGRGGRGIVRDWYMAKSQKR